jgi:hypothetical protein
LLVGIITAGAAALALARSDGQDARSAVRRTVAQAPVTGQRPQAPPVPQAAGPADTALVLVRRRGGIPDRWARRIRALGSVVAVSELSRTQRLLRTGVRPGYAVPLDALIVAPQTYARMVAADDRAAVRRLRSGTVLLSRTAAALRRRSRGDRLRLASGRSVWIAGVVSDDTARQAEVVLPRADVPWDERRNAQLLIATTDVRAVRRAVPDDRLTRVVDLAHPDVGISPRARVIQPLQLKRRFGEFAVRLPYGTDWIAIDPSWVRRNIVTRRLPILGAVTCHRRFFPPLRRVLAEVQRRGLQRLIDPGDYAGCYAPRRIPGSGNLSLHAWGLAIDLNASRNPQGRRPRQPLRLVHIFEDAGFAWGGRWPTAPDGMHFEWHGD